MKSLAPTLLVLLLLTLALPSAPAQQTTTNQTTTQPPTQTTTKDTPFVVSLGGRKVTLPAPPGYEEGASQFPSLRELFTKTEPDGTDLLAVYLPADVAATMRANGGKYEGLRVFHGRVSIDRDLRERDFSPADFEQAVAAARAQAPKMLSPGTPFMKERLKELEKRLGELGTGVTKYNLSATEPLGELDIAPNVYSMMLFLRMQVEVKGEKRSLPRLAAASLVRVNRRLIYVYTNRIFRSDADAAALEQFTRDWVRQIIAANPAD